MNVSFAEMQLALERERVGRGYLVKLLKFLADEIGSTETEAEWAANVIDGDRFDTTLLVLQDAARDLPHMIARMALYLRLERDERSERPLHVGQGGAK